MRTDSSTGTRRRNIVALTLVPFTVAALVAMPLVGGQAQAAGDGFLFHKPQGTLAIRGGYSRANASSDLFAVQQKQLTIGPRGFDAFSLGADLGFYATRRFDLGVSLDVTARSHGSEYRAWLDNNDMPITQTTNLSTVGLSANLKYNLRDRGRAISNFAWIPASYVPYVGIGGGVINYEFNQDGDFIDFATKDIVTDELHSSGWGALGQAFGGIAYTLNARYSLLSEARYTLSSARLNKDYSDLGRIDLSGLSLNVGTSIRF